MSYMWLNQWFKDSIHPSLSRLPPSCLCFILGAANTKWSLSVEGHMIPFVGSQEGTETDSVWAECLHTVSWVRLPSCEYWGVSLDLDLINTVK